MRHRPGLLPRHPAGGGSKACRELGATMGEPYEYLGVDVGHGPYTDGRAVKHIDKLVSTYIRDVCDRLPVLSKNMNTDLKAIAIDASPEQTMKVRLEGISIGLSYNDKLPAAQSRPPRRSLLPEIERTYHASNAPAGKQECRHNSRGHTGYGRPGRPLSREWCRHRNRV